MTSNGGIVVLLGRIFMCLIFLMSGFNKISNWDGTAAYMASKGMPAVPFFLVMAILVELVCALFVIAGFKTRAASLGLIIFLIPTTLIFHNFWALEGAMQQKEMFSFMKNISIIGGLLLLVGFGGGIASFDAKKE